MARITKAEQAAKAKRDARNARRRERRGAISANRKKFNDAFTREATRMGFSGQMTPRQTKMVTDSLSKRKGFDQIMRGARITSTRGGTLEVGSSE